MKRTILGVVGVAGLCSAIALVPTTAADSSTSPMRGDLDCADFPNRAAAQNNLDNNPSDPNGLDADNDGIACETNPCPCSTGGGGGRGGGGGGAPPPPPPPDPVTTKKLCGKFIGIPRSRACLEAEFKGGDLKEVNYFRFRNLPDHCSDGDDSFAFGKIGRLHERRNGFRGRDHSRFGGGHISDIDIVVSGQFKKDGEKARGRAVMRFNHRGAFCTTRERKWKAHD